MIRFRWALAALMLGAAPHAAPTQQGTPQGAPPRPPSADADSVRADSVLEARTAGLAAQLRCAVCQGISIQESPSGLAREMRDVVKEQLRAGRSEAEVKAYFVSKYGEWILLRPTPRGFNLLLLYVFPALVGLVGLAGLAVLVRRWTSAPAPDGGPEGAAPPD